MQWIMSTDTQLQRRADDVGAATRGHDFFVSGHKRRTHNACLLKAAATAVALLQVADERTVFKRKGENGLEWKLQRPREVFAQMIIDSGRAGALRRLDVAARCPYLENFSRIENIFRIEHLFDLTHYSEQL